MNSRNILKVVALLVGMILLVWGIWGYRVYGKWKWENKTISLLMSNNGNADESQGVYYIPFKDGTWIVTRFMEECCGDPFDAHIIKSSLGQCYLIDYHYCGTEGMGEISRYNNGINEFLGKVKIIRKIH